MKIRVEGANPELVERVNVWPLRGGLGFYVQVDTRDKHPDINYGSNSDGEITEQTIWVSFEDPEYDTELDACEVILSPETDEERLILNGISAEHTRRYGPQVIYMSKEALIEKPIARWEPEKKKVDS